MRCILLVNGDASEIPLANDHNCPRWSGSLVASPAGGDGNGLGVVIPSARQGAGVLSAITETQGFIVLDENRDAIRSGDVVEFMPLRSILGDSSCRDALNSIAAWRNRIFANAFTVGCRARKKSAYRARRSRP
jgi:hypothetical protein